MVCSQTQINMKPSHYNFALHSAGIKNKKKGKCNNQKGEKQQVAWLCAEYTLTLTQQQQQTCRGCNMVHEHHHQAMAVNF